MAQLQSNGLTIEYDTFGDRGADPVLLIMGLGMQMTAWRPEFCESLVARGHYVVRFDNRDIGLSTKFENARVPGKLRYLMHHVFHTKLGAPYSLEDMAADAVGVLDALGIDSAHVVGASMGGMIAQLLTVGHPARVKSLTSLMSTSGKPGLPRPNPELVSASIQRSFYPQGFLRQLAAVVADGSRVERLKTIRTPTLVIHGREDPLVPVEGGIDTARHVENSKLEIIEGMGHDIPSTLVDRMTGLIAENAARRT